MLDEEDFSFDAENDEDFQLSIIDEEKIKILNTMEEYLRLTRDNIKFNEKQDEENNFKILANSIDKYLTLLQLESDEEATEEDIFRAVKEVNLSHDQLSFSNIEQYAQDFREINCVEEVQEEDLPSQSEEPDLNDDDFDF